MLSSYFGISRYKRWLDAIRKYLHSAKVGDSIEHVVRWIVMKDV